MISSGVRAGLTNALRLGLIGPEPGEPLAAEVIDRPPSRWYLTGFLVPWNAPASQKADDDAQDELDLVPAGGGGDEDETTPENSRACPTARAPSPVFLVNVRLGREG